MSLEYGDSFVHLNEQDNWCHIVLRTHFNHNMIGGILRDEMVNLLSSIKRLTEFGYLMKNSWQQDIEETQCGQESRNILRSQ